VEKQFQKTLKKQFNLNIVLAKQSGLTLEIFFDMREEMDSPPNSIKFLKTSNFHNGFYQSFNRIH